MALLNVQNLTVRFHTRDGVINAVNNASFSVESGQVLGIVGESGSGKSVTCYSLMGLVPMPPGRIEAGTALFEGRDLLSMSETEMRKLRGSRIGMVFQDPMTSLNPFMTIASQLMEPLLIHQKMDRKSARIKAIAALEEVGITNAHTRINSYPHEFSGGMRQRVMIAMALINEPRLLIADEPTTALDVTVQAQILALLKRIQKDHDVAVIFITHDLAVVANMADHILVMKDGDIVEEGDTQALFHHPRHPYTIKLLDAVPVTAKPQHHKNDVDSIEFLTVKNLNKSYRSYRGFFRPTAGEEIRAVHDISLTVRKGEIMGLVGESGSGKSTFGRCIMRLIDSDSGQVLLSGVDLTTLSDKALRRARRDFQMIFQDPYASLNPRMTVFDTLAEPLLVHKLVNRNDVLDKVNQLMDEVGLSRRMIRKYPHEFSGGQRQRIAIARAIAVQPKLIVADEPVSALDVTIQAQILELLMKLTRSHDLTMLFISHDLSVVRYISDRVAVMQQGKIVEIGETEALFTRPEHSYTKTLLAAIPTVDISRST